MELLTSLFIIFFSCREIVQSAKEEMAALHRRNPALQPMLAIIQVSQPARLMTCLFSLNPLEFPVSSCLFVFVPKVGEDDSLLAINKKMAGRVNFSLTIPL